MLLYLQRSRQTGTSRSFTNKEKRPIRRCVSSLCFTFATEKKEEFCRKKLKHCKWTVKRFKPSEISIGQLNVLLRLHLRPIKLVVYKQPYSFKMMGYLILKHVSRLDAFSVYRNRTRLPSYALGRTTGAPEVRPTRSSRTKVSPSQISNAHDR